MAFFHNQSVFDMAEEVVSSARPTDASTTPTESLSYLARALLSSFGALFGVCCAVLAAIVALRRRIELCAQIFERLVYVFEVLTWRAGSAAAEPEPQDIEMSARGGRCLSDDELLALRAHTTQCKQVRPPHEYL